MEAQKSTGKYWLYFFVWMIILIILMIYVRQFFWLALPGVVTNFSRGLNLL